VVISEYLLEVRRAVDAIAATVDGVHTVRDLVQSVMQGRLPRTGTLACGGSYAVHGVGRTIATPSGAEVDIDVDLFGDGREIFDAWRVVEFAISTESGAGYPLDDIQVECMRLCRSGRLEVHHDGWFFLP
jgi:hypothetical protein